MVSSVPCPALILLCWTCTAQEFENDKASLLRMLQDFQKDSGKGAASSTASSTAAASGAATQWAPGGSGNPLVVTAVSSTASESMGISTGMTAAEQEQLVAGMRR